MKTFFLRDEQNNDAILKFFDEDIKDNAPAILIVPGGGYGAICNTTEGEPVAEKFRALGFRTFVLHYHIDPFRYPEALRDLLLAIALIRKNCKTFKINPSQLAVVGFSAGAHLTGTGGAFYSRAKEILQDDFDESINYRPDALILSYPVITFGPLGHQGSAENLLGNDLETRRDEFSLEKQVHADFPPCFLWHTVEDQCVLVENSLLMATALKNAKRPFELHIYPTGPHGMQLGYGRLDIAEWQLSAKNFLQLTCGFEFTKIKRDARVYWQVKENASTEVMELLANYGVSLLNEVEKKSILANESQIFELANDCDLTFYQGISLSENSKIAIIFDISLLPLEMLKKYLTYMQHANYL